MPDRSIVLLDKCCWKIPNSNENFGMIFKYISLLLCSKNYCKMKNLDFMDLVKFYLMIKNFIKSGVYCIIFFVDLVSLTFRKSMKRFAFV